MDIAGNWPQVFKVKGEMEFETVALQIFRYQALASPVYKEYLGYLGVDPGVIDRVSSIPFLPIELFKTHRIIADGKEPQLIFESSGTTGQTPSRHYAANAQVYEESFITAFRQSFGDPEGMCILALLPSYLERGNSSLVYMADRLIKLSGDPKSGFFLNDMEELVAILQQQAGNGKHTLLLGVSFALLDLAEQYPLHLQNIQIMETGGMKGRRTELTREELHDALREAFHVEKIYSEYGMTELLSQAYTDGSEVFTPPPWMKVLVRDVYDPLTLLPGNAAGAINIIDLANIYSCSFIATGDIGRVLPDGRFTVLGRMDPSEIRGCNLMVE